MNQKLIQDATEKMKAKTTEELVQIWQKNDGTQYSKEEFEAIRLLLVERGKNPDLMERYYGLKSMVTTPGQMQLICKDCGYVGQGKEVTKGSFFIEIFLWCIILFYIGRTIIAAMIFGVIGVVIGIGSLLMSVIFWFFFIGALFYSIWRSKNRYDICPKCKHSFSMIPTNSSVGQKLLSEQNKKPD